MTRWRSRAPFLTADERLALPQALRPCITARHHSREDHKALCLGRDPEALRRFMLEYTR